MIVRLFLSVASLLVCSITVSADDIYSLISRGHLKEATEALSAVSTAMMRDGNTLFFQSLLETDAAKSADLMEAALRTSVDIKYREEIYIKLAQYCFVVGDYHRLQQLITNYTVTWEQGRFGNQMLRFSVAVDQEKKEYKSALRQIDRYLLRYTNRDQQQWGKIDKSRVMLAHDKRIGANKLLKELSRQRSGPCVPQALYQLTIDAIDRERVDDAVFYYNLLREGFPSSVGLDALVNRLAGLSFEDIHNNEADKLTGTYYSVQVGVFSERSNAKRQADLFKQYGYKVEIKSRTISDVKYRVVYVGRFGSFNEAANFKKRLEAEHHEVFQVVAR
ncbi:MAG: hypothetical protein DRP47_08285 [Candidatus Zixiibacteriota bacterium]|nr:MAG: hypothetical protein DRP47_08285 [candidate division Zixibacteria bacterium]